MATRYQEVTKDCSVWKFFNNYFTDCQFLDSGAVLRQGGGPPGVQQQALLQAELRLSPSQPSRCPARAGLQAL